MISSGTKEQSGDAASHNKAQYAVAKGKHDLVLLHLSRCIVTTTTTATVVVKTTIIQVKTFRESCVLGDRHTVVYKATNSEARPIRQGFNTYALLKDMVECCG